jgi:hypothetical protein
MKRHDDRDPRRTITRLVAVLAAATLTANLAVVLDTTLDAAPRVVVAGAAEPEAGPTVRFPVFALAQAVSEQVTARYETALQQREAAVQGAGERLREVARQEAAAAAEAEREAARRAERRAEREAAREREAAAAQSPTAEPTPDTPAPGAGTSPTRASNSTSAATPPRRASSERPAREDCDHDCRGRRLAARVSMPLPADWSYEFEPGHPTYAGMADGRRKVVTLYVRETLSDETLLWVLYHEVGHAYDFAYLDAAGKQRWADTRGYAAHPWYPCNGCRDYAFPAGDWAESFAHCVSGLRGHFKSEMGGAPGSSQCGVLRDLTP